MSKKNSIADTIYGHVMKNSKRRSLYSCPYNEFHSEFIHHIFINANDAGEALQKAKGFIQERNPTTKFVWGKPKKVATNKKYNGA